VSADATSREALKLMAEHDVGAVLVLDGGRVAGIISERDHARNSIEDATSKANVPLRELITSCKIFANPTDSLQDCLNLMIDNHLRYLPVLEDGRPVAMLSLEDCLKEMVAYLERVFKEYGLDQQIVFLRGTYSC
jgi:CBS domain-containing protein